MGVTKAMTRHLAIFTTCPELGYLLPESCHLLFAPVRKNVRRHNPRYARGINAFDHYHDSYRPFAVVRQRKYILRTLRTSSDIRNEDPPIGICSPCFQLGDLGGMPGTGAGQSPDAGFVNDLNVAPESALFGPMTPLGTAEGRGWSVFPTCPELGYLLPETSISSSSSSPG